MYHVSYIYCLTSDVFDLIYLIFDFVIFLFESKILITSSKSIYNLQIFFNSRYSFPNRIERGFWIAAGKTANKIILTRGYWKHTESLLNSRWGTYSGHLNAYASNAVVSTGLKKSLQVKNWFFLKNMYLQ